jgi:hypothetical protein
MFNFKCIKNKEKPSGMVVHSYNPSYNLPRRQTLESQGPRHAWAKS